MEIKIQYKDNFVKFSDLEWFELDTIVEIKISVKSGEFCGAEIFGCYYDEFKKFALELELIYNFKSDKTVLKDTYFGSYVSFEMNKSGHIDINGILNELHREQSLKFRFKADQTSLVEFIKNWRSFR